MALILSLFGLVCLQASSFAVAGASCLQEGLSSREPEVFTFRIDPSGEGDTRGSIQAVRDAPPHQAERPFARLDGTPLTLSRVCASGDAGAVMEGKGSNVRVTCDECLTPDNQPHECASWWGPLADTNKSGAAIKPFRFTRNATGHADVEAAILAEHAAEEDPAGGGRRSQLWPEP